MPEQINPSEINQELVKFISEARKRGFEDWQIRELLLSKGWSENEIEKAFLFLKSKKEKILKKQRRINNKITYDYKNSITIHLDNKVLSLIEKRAKKNLLSVPEQIEDILRRSCVNVKNCASNSEKLDDIFISLFSRKQKGKPGIQ